MDRWFGQFTLLNAIVEAKSDDILGKVSLVEVTAYPANLEARKAARNRA